jgi:hypothetical protein
VNQAVSPLERAHARWGAAAARLGLAGAAGAAGAALLAAELDDSARDALLGKLGGKVAPRRGDLIQELLAEYDYEAAAAGVIALEARGAATPLRGYAGPWILAELELDPRVRQFCAGGSSPARAASLDHDLLSRVAAQIETLALRCREKPDLYYVIIRGRRGSGRDSALAELVKRIECGVLRKSTLELRQNVDLLEPELSGLSAVWDARGADPSPDDYDVARRWLQRSASVCVALLDVHQDAPDIDGRVSLRVELDPQTRAERCEGWFSALGTLSLSDSMRDALATTLALRNQAGLGLALRAVAALNGSARGDEDMAERIQHELAALVQPSALRGIAVEYPQVELSRVIAAEPVAGALERLLFLCQHHAAVEFHGRVGVKALLTGPSGTGKTLAARALANGLRRPLYRIDLSAVVSKWVGETEKNLRTALAAAELAGAVLLFDEGDALFGKRGEVSKGTDRYANIEVSYLLQALEAFDGIAIVTSNLRSNIDEAFERRFDVAIEFTPPPHRERALIWRQELAEAGAALPSNLLSEVARRAELTGGSIAAAARLARVLAHQRGDVLVSESDVRTAVHSEFLKLGSLVQAAQWASAAAPTLSR